MQVLQTRWDSTFSAHRYGFRAGRSAHQAVAQARKYIAAGYRWVVDIDGEKFFDRVNYDKLMARVAERETDQRVLKLLRAFLNAGVMEDGSGGPTDEGVPQGGPLSGRIGDRTEIHPLEGRVERRVRSEHQLLDIQHLFRPAYIEGGLRVETVGQVELRAVVGRYVSHKFQTFQCPGRRRKVRHGREGMQPRGTGRRVLAIRILSAKLEQPALIAVDTLRDLHVDLVEADAALEKLRKHIKIPVPIGVDVVSRDRGAGFDEELSERRTGLRGHHIVEYPRLALKHRPVHPTPRVPDRRAILNTQKTVDDHLSIGNYRVSAQYKRVTAPHSQSSLALKIDAIIAP